MFCPVCRADYPDDWKRCPKDEAGLLRSQHIGKYRIDKIIGEGGMGTVYKAYNPDTQSAVAIKLISGSVSGLEAARARFQREAAAVAALRTRHAVNIFDFGSDVDGTLYLVMEYLVGHPLRAEIAAPPAAMPLPRVHLAFDGALRGLGAAHRAQITHRDLKPENIFIADTDDGEVAKVLDFGIARVQGGQHALTQSGALMGTPAYMAPEQVAGNRGEIGPWSDVYAMGVILYEMFTGFSPFAAESVTEVLSRVLGRNFQPLQVLRPDLPPAVCDLVERAISDGYRERFPHADALREAWQSAFAAFPVEVRSATVPRFGGPSSSHAGDLGSAPTQTPAALYRDVAPSAQLATGIVDDNASAGRASGGTGAGHASGGAGARGPGAASTTGNRTAPEPGSPRARPAPVGSNPSLTPGGVVMETVATPPARRRAGLWAGLAGLAISGGVVAIILASRGDERDPPGHSSPDAGMIAAGVIATGPLDAGVVARDAVAAPAPVNDAAVAAAPPAGMVRFAAAGFDMGVEPDLVARFPDADTRHPVTVAPFWLDRTELTVAAFRAALPATKAGVDGDAADLPIRNLSWVDANTACRALGKRLPTEAEWELAATRSPLDAKRARLRGKGVDGPAAVGSHPGDCTSDGVCDLLGNVSEWTADRWRAADGSTADDAARTVRGASFRVAPTAAWYATVHARVKLSTDSADGEVGVRCAKDP